MNDMILDIHTHSIASGHYTTDTITDLVKGAVKHNLELLGISEHGPGIPHSCGVNYFRNLRFAPAHRMGIRLLYGAEVNIMDYDGRLDLPDEVMHGLDYCIAGMHLPCLKPGTKEENTKAYILAMQNPHIRGIAHPDDVKYPVDYKELVEGAIENHVFIEISNSSLSPDGYRGDPLAVRENDLLILEWCKNYHYPVLLSSDSHGHENIGNFQYALELIKAAGFPMELVLNREIEKLTDFLYFHSKTFLNIF